MSELQQDKQETNQAVTIYEREIELLHAALLDPAISTDQRQNALSLISKTYDLIDREKEKISAKKNYNFVQLYRENLDSISELARKNPMATSVLFYFFKIINRQNSVIVNQSVMASHFNVSRQTINTSLRQLKKMGFITSLRSGGACVYIINSDIVWTTYNDKRTTSTFTAQVVVSLEEQDPEVRTKAKVTHVPFSASELLSVAKSETLATV